MNKTDIGEILFCDPNREDEEAGGLSVSADLNFVLHFRPCDTYDGEFGFDWMREEYIYTTTRKSIDIETGEDVDIPVDPICLDAYQEKLKAQYKVGAFEGLEKPYFIPWLAMFSNHKEKTGNDVELKIEVHQIKKKWKQLKVTFECPEGITVDPPVLDVKKDKELFVKIYCNCMHEGGYIKAKTICDKNNPIEQCVGIINLFPNKEFPLNIKWVPLLRKGYLEVDRNFIKEKKDAICKYLKSNSLQQAMIMPTIVMEEEFIINEQQWNNEGKMENGRIKDESTLFKEYEAYEKEKNQIFKGVVILPSNMNHINEGIYGAGSLHSTTRNSCVIFIGGLTKKDKEGSPNYSTIAHEVGHVLGLDHTFERYVVINKKQYEDSKDVVLKHERILAGLQKDVNGKLVPAEEYWDKREMELREKGDNQNADVCKENAKTSRSQRIASIKAIEEHGNSVLSYETLLAYFHILFKVGMTKNIMDYFKVGSNNYDKFTSFFKWQWEIMQKEIQDYHS